MKDKKPPKPFRKYYPKDESKVFQTPGPPPNVPEGRSPLLRFGRSLQCRKDFKPETVIGTIKKFDKQTIFVCDTNIILSGQYNDILDCLVENNRLIIFPEILGEIETWLGDPKYNSSKLWIDLNDGRSGRKSNIEIASVDPADKDNIAGLEYYVNLISFRKKAYDVYKSAYIEEKGCEPTKMELNGYIQQRFEEVGLKLAQEGVKASGDKKKNIYNDEAIILQAFICLMKDAFEVVVLTADFGFLDQFDRFISIIYYDYQCYLFAEYMFANNNFFNILPLDLTDQDLVGAFVNKNGGLIDRGRLELNAILPPKMNPCVFYCWYFRKAPNENTFAQLSFGAVKELRDVINIKGKTNGMNTDKFGILNVRHMLGNYFLKKYGFVGSIGEEAFHDYGKYRFSKFDIFNCLGDVGVPEFYKAE